MIKNLNQPFAHQKGGIVSILMTLLVLGGLWFGWKYGDAMMSHNAITHELSEMMKDTFQLVPADRQIRMEEKISSIAKRNGATLPTENIRVTWSEDQNKMDLAASYTRSLDFGFYQFPLRKNIILAFDKNAPGGIVGNMSAKIDRDFKQKEQRKQDNLNTIEAESDTK